MRTQAVKNVLMKDGKVRRVPGDRAEELIQSGQAKRYVSNTIWRAMKLGIEVKNFATRDGDRKLRDQIEVARDKQSKKRKKADDKREKEGREIAEDDLEDRRAS